MLGLMQQRPLLVSSLVDYASTWHGGRGIVSRDPDGAFNRSTFAEVAARAKRVAGALDALGAGFGDRIATLAWNGHRHLELYYGVFSSGRVLHTVNPRLFPEQLQYIMHHAEDAYVFFDPVFAPLVEQLAPKLPLARGFVALCERSAMPSVKSASLLVLDEVDQMLDLGFIKPIRRIVRDLPKRRQNLFFSATMPADIRALAGELLSNPVVFTRTKRGADRVAKALDEAGVDAAAIHGNKSQGQRERALGAFRAGKTRALVATDIAARGIDIDGVTHVVNFELPEVAEAYVHRVSRTARAGNAGRAISLCDHAERDLLRAIERLTRVSLAKTDRRGAAGPKPDPVARQATSAPQPAPVRPHHAPHRDARSAGLPASITRRARRPGQARPRTRIER